MQHIVKVGNAEEFDQNSDLWMLVSIRSAKLVKV